jgi:phosphoglycerate dehydrogenase-like enzyme
MPGRAEGDLPRVLICDPIHPEGVAYLRGYCCVDEHRGPALTPAELEARIGAYQGIVVAGRTQLPAPVIQRGERLRVIARAGATLENIDVSAALEQGITVVNSPDPDTLAVAEHTWALMLGLARQVAPADRLFKLGDWSGAAWPPTGLAGKTLGIIGYGAIGRQVAKRARAFDMRVLVYQNRLTPELALSPEIPQVELADLMAEADVVSIHLPQHPANEGLIGAAALARMKPTAFLINTARSGIVDEAALLAALQAGRLAGAGLDVALGDANPALVRHPRVLAAPLRTPGAKDAQRQAALTVCEQVVAVLRQQRSAHNLRLQVVPLDEIVPHEAFNDARVADLAARLVADGRLINPPVAAPSNGKYIILDGATRLTAFKHLGYPHIILQVVDVEREPVQLHTWYHAVRGSGPAALVERLASVPGLALEPARLSDLVALPLTPGSLGYLAAADGQGYRLAARPTPGYDWLDVLNRMVDAYSRWGRVERTLTTDIEMLAHQYPDFAGLVVFPQFTPQLILDLADLGRTVPAGITRFIIPGRILRLNAPLEMLSADEPLAVKRSWLDNLVRERLSYRHVRYYEEPVVLLDE